ncbi:AraC family transcriptional regulator [Ciceribacter azotifigens]|uniref:helix-turn-helix transcriptional regulator n=1 Tax=Ciceribacter azotifigens TaxID=2069303 RepID=UPI003A8C83C1
MFAKRDRLAAFFEAYELTAVIVPFDARKVSANLAVTGRDGVAERVILCAQSNVLASLPDEPLAAAVIDFGGVANPLVSALPEQIEIALGEGSTLLPLVEAFVREAQDSRCGRQAALDRLCELVVLLVLREAIDRGATAPGLLAGLAHPTLQRALTAIHDAPARSWRVGDLAVISGLSRSRFMALFPKVVGLTPLAYLTAWRLALGQRQLMRGDRVKAVARRVGFSSAEAFSRAYSRRFGFPPAAARTTEQQGS